jgi:RHS repeat-associated protein
VIPIPYVSGAATVQVNNMPAGRCGDIGMGIWCGGYFPMFEIFLGSSSVWIEGARAARIGVDITKHCTFSTPKPNDPPLGPMIGTTVSASPNVIIGGVPMPSLTAMAMGAAFKLAFKGLGKVIRLAQATKAGTAFARGVRRAANNLMDDLGVGPASALRNRVNRALCTVTGHPVDVATGKVFVDAIDFELSGPLPLIWQRVWYSTSTYCGPLGWGWHHGLDQAIALGTDQMAVRLGDGRGLVLPLPAIGETYYDRTAELSVTRYESRIVLQTFGRVDYHFEPGEGRSNLWPLRRIAFLQNWMRLDRDSHGRLSHLETLSGRRFVFSHDDRGLLLSIDLLVQDAEPSRLVEYRYDEHSRLREVVDSRRQTRTHYHYSGKLLAEEVAANGGRFRFAYDGRGPFARCVRTEGDGRALYRDLTYDLEAGCTYVGYVDDRTTRFHWHADGTVWRTEIEPGFDLITNRDAALKPSMVSTFDGGSYQFSRDDSARSTSIVDPHGNAFQYTLDDNGQPSELKMPDGSIWSRLFDDRGELTAVIDPAGRAFRYDYDGRGLLRTIASPDDRRMAFTHDAAGLLASETDWAGGVTSFEHDLFGYLSTVALPDGATFHFERDGAGRLNTLHRPDGSVRTFTWNAMDDLVSYRDEGNATWRWSYNLTRQPVCFERPDGSSSRFEYDTEGRLTAIVNRRGGRARFERDRRGRVIRETDFDGRVTNYVYGKERRPKAIVRCDGSRIKCEYDLDGQLISLTDAHLRKTSWTYDWAGRVIAAAGHENTVELTYDTCGNLVRSLATSGGETSPQGAFEVTYLADARGRRTGRRLSNGANLSFTYDANGWLTEVLRDRQPVLQIDRDIRGRPVAICHPDGSRLTQTFDSLGRLVAQRFHGAEGYSRAYRYGSHGALVETAENDRTILRAEYDSYGRLAHVTNELNWQHREITRDEFGFATCTSHGVALAFGTDGRVVTCADAQPQYDELGRLSQIDRSDGTLHFEYDGRDRLCRILRGAEELATYGYDALDRRIWKRTPEEIRHFVWDEWSLVAEVSGDNVTEYVFDPATRVPLARFDNETVQIYHTDHIGTPFRLTDSAGHMLWDSVPDLESGCLPRPAARTRQPLRYPGQYFDEETKLHYNGYRYYSPAFGRYITADPAGLLVSDDLYGYVENPLHLVDPWGLAFERQYTRDEVNDILDDSEGRPSPTTGEDGHPRGRHVNRTNEQMRQRVNTPGGVPVATTFEGSQAQTRAATEALNSPEGQAALRQLDTNPTQTIVPVHAPTSGETVREARRGRGFFVRSTAKRTTVIVEVWDRTPGAERIHIQTCYGRL